MAEAKRALITGITGQDGSYLAELLLGKGYAVHGVVRRTSNLLRSRIEHLRADESIYGRQLFLHYGDLSDGTTLRRIFAQVEPAEVYHLAGQSHVGLSFEIPESTSEEVAMATLRLLEISRDQEQPLRFYHASSSEINDALRLLRSLELADCKTDNTTGGAPATRWFLIKGTSETSVSIRARS